MLLERVGDKIKTEVFIEASIEVSKIKNNNKKHMKEKQSIYKLKKSSAYSYSVTIPKEMIDKYGWKEKQKLIIKDKGRGKLEISDWRRA